MQPDLLKDAMRACRKVYLGVGTFSFCLNLLMLATPIYMMQIYDRVLATQNTDTLLLLTVIVVAALVVFAILDALRLQLLSRVGNWLDRRLSAPVLASSVDEALSAGGKVSAQGLRDLGTVRGYMSGQAVVPLFDAPWIPVFLGIVFLIHPVLGWISVGGAAVLFILAIANELLTRRALTEANGASAKALNDADSAIRNADVISAMGMLPNLTARWRDVGDTALNKQTSAGDLGGAISSFARFIRLGLQVSMLGVGAFLVILQEMSPGAMIAASIIMARGLAPIEQLINAWKSFIAARTAIRRLGELIGQHGDAISEDTTTLPRPEGHIDVEKVGYVPPGVREPVLKMINFHLDAGEALGIVGPSGAGKTTLVRLIVGSLTPTAGQVRLDGADVAHWDDADRGQYVGYLPQNVELFTGTVRENIARLGEASDEDVVAAAQLAGAHELILGLPKGYDTPIGDGGVPISGGQRQRIGLARAVFGNPSLVVLDEPNAHLDAHGEQSLVEAVVRLREQGTTVILIAQRAGVVAQVDKMLILKNGALEDFGPRDEILQKLGRPVSPVKSDDKPAPDVAAPAQGQPSS